MSEPDHPGKTPAQDSWAATHPEPPGHAASWTLWAADPPPYKRGRIVELWSPRWGNETTFVRLDDLAIVFVPLDLLWWRVA